MECTYCTGYFILTLQYTHIVDDTKMCTLCRYVYTYVHGQWRCSVYYMQKTLDSAERKKNPGCYCILANLMFGGPDGGSGEIGRERSR